MNYKFQWIQLLMTFLLLNGSTRAQSLSFEHITVEEGLSQTSVLCFAQDQQGFVWIGTRSGLNRFDSKQFKIYKKSPDQRKGSLSQDYVTALLSDSKNRLWIGTLSGLNKYNPANDQFTNYQLFEKNENSSVYCFIEDHRGRIWAGTGSGLKVLENSKDELFKSFKVNGVGVTGAIKAIKEDFRGNLWFGVNNYLCRLRWKNNAAEIKRYCLNPDSTGSSPDYQVSSLEEDEYRNLWIGTQGAGLFRYQEETDAFTLEAGIKHPIAKLSTDVIRKIKADGKGQLWIGTLEGVAVLGIKSKSIISYQHLPENKQSLSQNSIYDLFFDKTGNLWVGTYYGGINLLYSKKTPFFYFQNNGKKPDLNNNVVSAIVEDGTDQLWVGTEGGGLNHVNLKTGKVSYLKFNANDPRSIGSNLVKCLYKSKSGQLWAGTHGGGLNLLEPDGLHFTRYKMVESPLNGLKSNNIVHIVEDETGVLWLATEDNGLHSFDPKRHHFEHYHSKADELHKLNIHASKTLEIDHLQTIWYGGDQGLYFKKKGSSSFQEFIPKSGSNSIFPIKKEMTSLMTDSKHQLWIGTGSNGLFCMNISTGKIKSYHTKDGLPSESIKDLIEDDSKNLWVSTDNGLCKLDPHTDEIISFNVFDGLPGNEFNYNANLKDHKGQLYLGGLNGLVHFDPANIEKNNQKANLVFTSLRIGNNEQEAWQNNQVMDANLPLAQKITLSHGQNNFTLQFSLLNFIKAKKNRYFYRLEEFEKEWNLTNQGMATYTNLAPGTYHLKIKGGNNDNYWLNQENMLTIEILPPFWATWWAYCFYIALLTLLVIAITRFFWLRAKYKQEKELHQFKLDFFTNISHEIRTHLTLIASPLETILHEQKPPDFVKRQLKHIQKHTGILSELVGELLDFRKVETGHQKLLCKPENLVTILKESHSAFLETALQKNIRLELIFEKEDLMAEIDRIQIQKVFNNLLTNALKFSFPGGKVLIELVQTPREAQIKIIDNGPGISPRYFKKIFTNFFQTGEESKENHGYGIGLALSKSIVELHGGRIEVSSKPAKEQEQGMTVFTVFLPLFATQQSPNSLQSTVAISQTETEAINNKIVTAGQKNLPNILIIEDNDELRAFVKDALLDSFQIEEAINGEAGLALALEQIPDLIVSDIMMPEMDGLELCDRLKKDSRSSHIPIILLTAKANLNDQIAGFERRADGYLTKPFNVQLLASQINNLIENRKMLQDTYRKRFLSQTEGSSTLVSFKAEELFLDQLEKEILANLENQEFHVGDLAKAAAMSQPVLYKKVKALTGLSVNDFIKSVRLKKAVDLLKQHQYSIHEVSYLVGFADRKYFSKEFKKAYGINPSEYPDQASAPDGN